MKILSTLVLFFCLLSGPALAADGNFSVPVNINTADATALATGLNGVGAKKAEAIIEYRESVGGFKSVDELTAVKGIGLAFIERNRERIILQ